MPLSAGVRYAIDHQGDQVPAKADCPVAKIRFVARTLQADFACRLYHDKPLTHSHCTAHAAEIGKRLHDSGDTQDIVIHGKKHAHVNGLHPQLWNSLEPKVFRSQR